jgi:hypothetical protein
MKVGIYTVPHTGTNFVMRYLDCLGLYPEAVSAPRNYHQRHAGYTIKDWDSFSKLKCIVTARDPYLSAIRFLRDDKPNAVEQCAEHWNVFFDTYRTLDHFIVDLAIRDEERLEHLIQAAEFVGIDTTQHIDNIEGYADSWQPANSRNSGMKTRYIETGELPEGHNWSLLDDAVNWYAALPTNNYEQR